MIFQKLLEDCQKKPWKPPVAITLLRMSHKFVRDDGNLNTGNVKLSP